eukprot:GFKZ01008402.1.p2 GENE.GFKZ01008402.1~~GFKZ01008402.1.p2  ORF type:complete len:119 (+),score=3.53 GFKZ01008402.1:374-730(+)
MSRNRIPTPLCNRHPTRNGPRQSNKTDTRRQHAYKRNNPHALLLPCVARSPVQRPLTKGTPAFPLLESQPSHQLIPLQPPASPSHNRAAQLSPPPLPLPSSEQCKPPKHSLKVPHTLP